MRAAGQIKVGTRIKPYKHDASLMRYKPMAARRACSRLTLDAEG